MKKSALVVLFLLLISQSVSAQSDDFYDWRVNSDVDVIDDSVEVELSKFASEVDSGAILSASYAALTIRCNEKDGDTTVLVSFHSGSGSNTFWSYWGEEGIEVTYRIGTDEAVTHRWIAVANMLLYTTLYIDDDSDYLGTADGSVLVAALVQNNSRFIVRVSHELHGEIVTAIWNIEGLADVIDECMAVFD